MPDVVLTRTFSSVFIATSLVAGTAHADEIQDVKAQVEALQKRLADLEQRRPATAETAAPSAGVVTGGATPGSFKLPGSSTSVTLGGYVKFDAIYSDRSAGVASTGDQEFEPATIAVGPQAGANERNQVKFHARQSRLFAKTSTPTPLGDAVSYVEADFFGAPGNESVSNSNNLRIRHAYGSLGRLLFGQTWTTFSDVDAYPETVDFGGPAGQIFARQAQIRWTQPFAGGQWAVALENPETVVALPNGTAFRADDDRFPDLAANVRFDTGFGRYTVAALVRQVRVDSASDPASRAQKTGAALGVNAVVPFGRDDLRAYAYFGNGIGRYANGLLADGTLSTAGTLRLPNQWLASAAYRHFWTPTLRSTLAVSGVASRGNDDTAATVTETAQSAHVNAIWSPVPRTNFGLEYLYGRRSTHDGTSGRLNRVQLGAQYLF